MADTMLTKVKVGDWIAFHQAGAIVIAAVRYVQDRELGRGYYNIDTDRGRVADNCVLEIRRDA